MPRGIVADRDLTGPSRRRAIMMTTNDLKADLNKSLEHLQTLRDEVRVKLHLAGLDAKQLWEKLEPEIEAAIKHARSDVSEAARKAIHESAAALQKLRDSMSS
jgi:ElaB/YqjD/DUF883 family membrane-anchored ribosome-binding protein